MINNRKSKYIFVVKGYVFYFKIIISYFVNIRWYDVEVKNPYASKLVSHFRSFDPGIMVLL